MKFFRRLLWLVVFVTILIVRPWTDQVSMAQQSSSSGSATNTEIRLSTLEDNVRAMNGRVEQLEYAVRRLDQTLQRLQGDYDTRLSHLESVQTSSVVAPQVINPAVPAIPPQPLVSTSTSNEAPISGSLGAVKTQDGHVTGGVNSPKAPPLPNAPADYGLTAQEQYDRAFSFLRQANYDDAEKAFRGFIDKNPKDKLIDNAKYWYGETLYVRGRYDESAVAFADAYQQNPQGNKAPDSLLKLAMSLSAIDKVPDACATLIEMKNKYPNASSTVRSRAEEERQKLKCSAH